MLFAKIRRDTPEQVYVTVRNNDASSAMSVGRVAMWDFPVVDAGTGTGDGYSVKYGITTATQQNHAGLFAGIVAGRDIPIGEFGSVQVYGYNSAVYVTGISTTPFSGALFTVTSNASAAFQTLVLRPAACGGAVGPEYLGQMPFGTTIATTEALDLRRYLPGGYVIPLGHPNGGVTCTWTSTCSVKAFIKCL